MQPVERHCRQATQSYTLVTFDGSLTGGGATLQVGVSELAGAAMTPVWAFFSTRWTAADLEMIDVNRADPAGQARVEALTFAIAVNTWRDILMTSQGNLAVRGDALGDLQDVVTLRAKAILTTAQRMKGKRVGLSMGAA